MSVYASLDQLQGRVRAGELVELTDESGAGTLDRAKVEQALSDADDEINGYVAGSYKLPIAPASSLLERIACDIARYRLWSDRATDEVKARYSQAVATLRDIAKGIVKLDSGAEEIEPRDGAILIDANERVFSRDSLRGF